MDVVHIVNIKNCSKDETTMRETCHRPCPMAISKVSIHDLSAYSQKTRTSSRITLTQP